MLKFNLLKNEMKIKNLDAIISMSYQSKIWYANFEASDGFLIIEKNQTTLFVDGRYYENAIKNAKNVKIKLLEKNTINDYFFQNQKQFKKVGIEKEYLSVLEFDKISKMLPFSIFIPISAQNYRIIKDKEEINKIKKACEISLNALSKLKKLIKPGITEKSLDAHLSKFIKDEGGSKNAFEPIIVSGKNGSLPHGKPSLKKLQNGELITIDFGALYQGYASDITRTFHVGKVEDQKLLEIEKIVKKAQILGIKAIKPGISTNEIDQICRDYITKKGYGKYFIHSTGHGLGIDVHELPYLTSKKEQNKILKEGMIVTVEPGIYIPNYGGIRIEDDILVTKEGSEILSKLN